MVDIVLALYVNARCGVARRRPPEWGKLPERSVVRGEVSAIVGLLRLAGVLPHDPRGSIPKTRIALRKCKCCEKHEASPRGYTFMWELEAAWRLGVDRSDPREVCVWAWAVVTICYLLRPVYTRSLSQAEVSGHEAGARTLRWQRDDKGRPAGRPADAPALTVAPPASLPAKHPRLTAASHPLLRTALSILEKNRPASRDATDLLFCRVEAARTTRVPKGAIARPWKPPGGTREPVTAYWWPRTPLSEEMVTRHLRRFLTPIIGPERAAKRVPSGLRGGGEMELMERGAPLPMRATQGWWRAKRLAAEGAMVTYEGCSVECMALWTSRLGSRYIRVLAPGVYTTTIPAPGLRSVAARRHWRELYAGLLLRNPAYAMPRHVLPPRDATGAAAAAALKYTAGGARRRQHAPSTGSARRQRPTRS